MSLSEIEHNNQESSKQLNYRKNQEQNTIKNHQPSENFSTMLKNN